MSSFEQIGLPILIVGVLITLIGFGWLLRVAFQAGYFWGSLLIIGSLATLGGVIWLLQEAFETRFLLGVAAVALAPYLLFIPLHRRRAWKPTLVIFIGLATIASPIAVNWFVETFIPKGPRERVVEGETHLTLTGLANYDYSQLATRHEVKVLQIANADVTDQTLEYLKDMRELQELDLNDTQVSDAGLALLGQLPALEKLRLRNTKISDEGFKQHLLEKDRLLELDLTGTAVASKTVRDWKKAKEGRKALK